MDRRDVDPDPGLPEPVRAALAAARSGRGWSLRAAAAQLGIGAPYLCRMEGGQRTPRADVAAALTDVYRLDREPARGLWRAVDRRYGLPDEHAHRLTTPVPAVADDHQDQEAGVNGPASAGRPLRWVRRGDQLVIDVDEVYEL